MDKTCSTCRFWDVLDRTIPEFGACECPRQSQIYTEHLASCPEHQPKDQSHD